jgi:hypothetical protein
MKINNSCFERVEEFKYLGKPVVENRKGNLVNRANRCWWYWKQVAALASVAVVSCVVRGSEVEEKQFCNYRHI